MVVGTIIKGTVGGYRTIYISDDIPEESKRSIGYDVRSDSPPEMAVGEECYAISFSNLGRICKKYRIMYDLKGDLRVGFLEISLMIPFNKRINGDDVKSILDALMIRFIVENGHELRLIKGSIDSGIINEVLNNHKDLFGDTESRDFSISPGTKDAAYIYYHEGKLKNYFEDVNHNQYKDFKQILLLAEKTKGVGKILNAISHSSEITDLDIENPDYILKINGTNEIKIRRLDNDQYLRNGDNVKMNTQIIIEISRPFNEPKISEKGAFEGLKNKIGNIVCIDPNSRSITINLPDFKPKEKIIRLNISDGEVVSDYSIEKIIFKSSNGQEKAIRNQSVITFKGEETEEEWYCEIKNWTQYKDCKGDRFTPAHVQNNTIPLILDKKKVRNPKVDGNGETGTASPPSWVFYGFIITALLLIVGVLYLHFWGGDGNDVTGDGPELNGKPPINVPLDKTYAKKIIDYCNGMEVFNDTLNSFNNRLSDFKPDSIVNVELIKAIGIRHAIDNDDSTAILNLLKSGKFSGKQKSLLESIKNNDINHLFEIPDRKTLSLAVIKKKLDSIISSKVQKPLQQGIDLRDSNRDQIPNRNAGENENIEKNESEITTANSKDKAPANGKVDKNKYSNDIFKRKIIGFKTAQDFNQLEEHKLTDEQKKLRDKIKSHYPEFRDDKNNRFKANTSWEKFKEGVLKLK